VGALREGMVPRAVLTGRDQDALCYPGRPLTKGQVRRLRDQAAGAVLEVELAVPFAPILAAAGVLTVVLGGSVIQPLVAWFAPLQKLLAG